MDYKPIKSNRTTHPVKLGYIIGACLTSWYRNLPAENRQPFYIDTVNKRGRVHHGLAGAVFGTICLIGASSNDDTTKILSEIGLGVSSALIEDDKEDANRWLTDLFT
jgi:hypothetical protein